VCSIDTVHRIGPAGKPVGASNALMNAKTALVLIGIVAAASAASAEPADPLCGYLLEQRRIAEAEGRLDFSAIVADGLPHVDMGSSYAVGRINFTGHEKVNDSTLRRAMTLHERELFDVGKLRRSLARLNEIGLAEPLTIADLAVTKRADGVTADLTIPLRERGRRWWSLSGPIIPGLGSYQASISSRLPAWGRGLIDASTYYVTFNVLGLARPLLGVLPFLSKAPPAVIAIERPYLPGQGLLSGFALSPQLSAGATIGHYGRTQLSRLVRSGLQELPAEALAVPVTGSGAAPGEVLVCTPPRPGAWWLRRGVVVAADLVLAIVLP
jgi:hypothetical protein